MNKGLTYYELMQVEAAKKVIGWQLDESAYLSLSDFVNRAQEFVQTVQLAELEEIRLKGIQEALAEHRKVFVEVANYWFEVHTVHEQDRIIVLRRPKIDDTLQVSDRVFIWEIKYVSIGQ